jgi:amino-acid N-acetyltransferase
LIVSAYSEREAEVLVQHQIITRARRAGVRELYLMTTTAEKFFARRGFVRVDRSAAEPTLKDTREWRDLCPASAAVMRLKLD